MWRGPMLHGAVTQMLRDTDWGDLDYLIIDMPPGTGDIALTLSQLLPITGAVVVCTPQDVALLDAVKAIAMFRKVKTPVLGVVENMSSFVCPDCGSRHTIFGNGGAKRKGARTWEYRSSGTHRSTSTCGSGATTAKWPAPTTTQRWLRAARGDHARGGPREIIRSRGGKPDDAVVAGALTPNFRRDVAPRAARPHHPKTSRNHSRKAASPRGATRLSI